MDDIEFSSGKGRKRLGTVNIQNGHGLLGSCAVGGALKIGTTWP